MQAPTHDKDTGENQPREGPFDFKSPVQTGRPEVPSDHGYTAPYTAEFTEEEKERGRRCGRALLERAMLGPPLAEPEMGVKGSSGTVHL